MRINRTISSLGSVLVVLGIGVQNIVLLDAETTVRTAQAAAPRPAEEHQTRKPSRKLVKAAANGIKDQYIVVLDDAVVGRPGDTSIAGELADALVATYGGKVRHKFTHALNGFSARMTEAQALAMSHDTLVAYIEQDSRVSFSAVQSQPTWGLDRIDQRPLPLNAAYSYTYTGAGVRVYVLDSGVLTGHTEFGGRAYTAVDYIGDGYQDCHGHGTHVAGTIAGRTYGVAKGATIMSIRVGTCTASSAELMTAGVNWLVRYHQKPAVANMSMETLGNYVLDAAVTNAVNAGITFVAAAGNKTIDACYVSPARVPAAIAVGATNWNDFRAPFSNYGPCVDIFAPGTQITSASNTGPTAVRTMDGTSMAAPHVAGTAAIYLSWNPVATPLTVRSVILNTATTYRLWNIGPGSPNRLLYSLMRP